MAHTNGSRVLLWLLSTVALASFLGGPGAARAQEAPAPAGLAPIDLPAPETAGGMPLMQALKARKSVREVADRPLPRRQLSGLLWAADGVNRAGGERTAPSALKKYPVDVYVVLAEGVYLYQPATHRLVPVAAGDHRKASGTQDYVYKAPVNLVYVADLSRFGDTNPSAQAENVKWAAIEAGCIAQNVYLYCASEGLGATVRASISAAAFGKVIGLRPDQAVIIAQSVGIPETP